MGYCIIIREKVSKVESFSVRRLCAAYRKVFSAIFRLGVHGVRVRTVGHLKVPLLLLRTVAFIGATPCGIIDLHGLMPCV